MRDAAAALEAKRLAVEAEAAAAARASRGCRGGGAPERAAQGGGAHGAQEGVGRAPRRARRGGDLARLGPEAAGGAHAAHARGVVLAALGVDRGAAAGPRGHAGERGERRVRGRARATAAAKAAGLSGLSGLGRGVASMLRPPGALAEALSPAPGGGVAGGRNRPRRRRRRRWLRRWRTRRPRARRRSSGRPRGDFFFRERSYGHAVGVNDGKENRGSVVYRFAITIVRAFPPARSVLPRLRHSRPSVPRGLEL